MYTINNLDENFNKAIELYENEYSHTELVIMLKNGDIVEKQISVLKINEIQNEKDAEILVSNLIGQDGKVREAVSFRLKEFMADIRYLSYFESMYNYEIFMQSIIDINGNICRNTISAISNLNANKEFCAYLSKTLMNMVHSTIESINKFDIRDGKYKVNKEFFKLYWCLETIFEFVEYIDFEIIKEAIFLSKNIEEYTIKEKIAKILTKIVLDDELLQIQQELKNDENYYVRRF